MAILKASSVFLRKNGLNACNAETSGARPVIPHVGRNSESSKYSIRNWSISGFSRISTQRSSKYPTTGSFQDSENQPLIRHLHLDTDHDSMQSDACAADDDESPISEDDAPQESTPVVHFPVIPLAIAQRRQNIQKRIAEFTSSGEAPFAVRADGLLPLKEALTRNDIRRRQEGFEILEETKSRRVLAMLNLPRKADGAAISLPPDVATEDCETSAYSLSSRLVQDSQVLSSFEEDSPYGSHMSSSYSAIHLLSDYDQSLSSVGELRRSIGSLGRNIEIGGISLDTSGEGSLMRIAVTELGW